MRCRECAAEVASTGWARMCASTLSFFNRAEAIAFTKHLYRLQRLGLAGGGDALEGGFLYRRAET